MAWHLCVFLGQDFFWRQINMQIFYIDSFIDKKQAMFEQNISSIVAKTKPFRGPTSPNDILGSEVKTIFCV